MPCIHDTTLVRGWLPSTDGSVVVPVMLRATLAQYSLSRLHLIWPDAFGTILQFLDAANTHPDQLTLAEFSALRTRRLVQNLDMMAIARTVELGDKKTAQVLRTRIPLTPAQRRVRIACNRSS